MENLNLIVAVASNNCIGRNNDIPWTQKTDMKFFRDTTTNNAVIMGRKTFESMKSRPLPNRLNIVVSELLPDQVEGVTVVRSIEDGIKACKAADKTPFIIGGGGIYKAALPLVQTIFITVMDITIDGDTFFPELNYREWEQEVLMMGEADASNNHKFTIYKLSRL